MQQLHNQVTRLADEYKKIGATWLSERPSSCLAIAFDWYYPEWTDPRKINLFVNATKVHTDGRIEILKEYTLKTVLDKINAPKAKGASEPLGFIPKTNTYDIEKQGIIERNLADFLAAFIYDQISAGEKTIIIQGPFFPKLIGRLGYRHFDHSVTIAAITFRNEWMPLNPQERNQTLNEEFRNSFIMAFEESFATKGDEEKPESQQKRRLKFYQLADLKPVNGLSEVIKSWCITFQSKTILILEVFCQFPNPDAKSPWVEKLGLLQTTFKFPGMLFEQGKALWLPFALACASDRCKYHGRQPSGEVERIWLDNKHWEYLYFYEQDTETMYDNEWKPLEVVSKRSLLYLTMYSDQLYKNLEGKCGLHATGNSYERGLNISAWIKKQRERGTWTIEKWRSLI